MTTIVLAIHLILAIAMIGVILIQKSEGGGLGMSGGGGMYLLVTPNGSRYWRLDYRFGGKRRERMIPIC